MAKGADAIGLRKEPHSTIVEGHLRGDTTQVKVVVQFQCIAWLVWGSLYPCGSA
jgi:hypothetical protein